MVSCKEKQKQYIDFITQEIYQLQGPYDTIYIGGGTPNSLSFPLLKQLLGALNRFCPREYSIEVNPEEFTPEQAILFRENKINRVSIGVETFHPSLLEACGRHHTNEMVFNTIHWLRKEHIQNINCDLIFGLPKETLNEVKEDLEIFLSLKVPHLSFYGLILEEKTIFGHQVKKKKLELPDEDLQSEMFSLVNEVTNENGYEHYEISNYALPGFESVHNMLYWNFSSYDAIGLGAASFNQKERITNAFTLKDFFQGKKEIIPLTNKDLLNEKMMMGLRMKKGILISEIEKEFKISLFKEFPEINQLMNQGLLEIFQERLKLTNKGLFLGNLVFEIFV